MRRSGREIKDFNEIADVLCRTGAIRFVMSGDKYPYAAPLQYGF